MDKKENPGYEGAVLATGEWLADALADYLYDYFGAEPEVEEGVVLISLTKAIAGMLDERDFEFAPKVAMRDFLIEYLVRNPKRVIKMCRKWFVRNDVKRLLELGIPEEPWAKDEKPQEQERCRCVQVWSVTLRKRSEDGACFARIEESSSEYGHIDIHADDGEFVIVFAGKPREEDDLAVVAVPMEAFAGALTLIRKATEMEEENQDD